MHNIFFPLSLVCFSFTVAVAAVAVALVLFLCLHEKVNFFSVLYVKEQEEKGYLNFYNEPTGSSQKYPFYCG